LERSVFRDLGSRDKEVVMQATSEVHPSDDALELYALGQLPSTKLEDMEEHLLICSGCQSRLTDVDAYVANMKQVCREIEVTEAVRKLVKRSLWSDFVDRFFRIPAPVLVGAAALVAFGIAIPGLYTNTNSTVETEVRLTSARRGLESTVQNAGNLRLNIDTSEITKLDSYQIVVADSAGKEVWRSQVRPQSSTLSARLPMRLANGAYWVRVNSPAGESLREFSLNLR
jgi:hypothetical protein